MKRIKISVWGKGTKNLRLANYAVAQDGEARIDAVARSVERTTGLVVCGGPARDGREVEGGRTVAHHYHMTLGTRCRGGGYSPEVELWVSIPVEV